MLEIDDCHLSNFTIRLAENAAYVSYGILLPIYYVVGLIGNVTLLIAFYKRSKVENAYVYQVLLTVSKTLEIFTYGTYALALTRWSSMHGDGSFWFERFYWLQVVVIRGGALFHMVFIMSSLFFSVAMTLDRVVALWKPFVYKNLNHKKYQILSTVLCFLVPFLTSIPLVWYYEVVWGDPISVARPDEPYLASPLDSVYFSNIRVILRLLFVVILVCLSATMTILFKKRMSKVGQLAASSNNNTEKEEARKAANKTLVLLNVLQSILMFFNQVPHVGLHIALHSAPYVQRCYGQLGSICDACILVTDSIDLFVVLAINKKMRAIVKKVLPCTNQGNTSVVSLNQGGRRNVN